MGKISDSKLATTLMKEGSVSGTAAVLNVPEFTVKDRIKMPSFQNELLAVKDEIVLSAALAIIRKLDAAVEVVADIMTDAGNDPQTRLQAAKTIIDYAINHGGEK